MTNFAFRAAGRAAWIFVWVLLGLVICVAIAIGVAMLTAEPAKAEVASWYGRAHHGRPTASGQRFNMHSYTTAHKTLAFGTRLRVCRHGCATVTINDRGPFIPGRSLDLSAAAARAIGLAQVGVGRVSMQQMR